MKMKEIHEIAKRYVVESIGNMASVGSVYFSEEVCRWSVQILAKTPKGIFTIGTMELDQKGNIIDMPEKELLLEVLRRRAKRDFSVIEVPTKDLKKVQEITKVNLIG